MIDHNLNRALDAQRQKILNGGPGSGIKGHHTAARFNEWHGVDAPVSASHVDGLMHMLRHDPEAHDDFFNFKREGRGGSHLPSGTSERLARKAVEWSGPDAPNANQLNAMHWAASMDGELHHSMLRDVRSHRNEMQSAEESRMAHALREP